MLLYLTFECLGLCLLMFFLFGLQDGPVRGGNISSAGDVEMQDLSGRAFSRVDGGVKEGTKRARTSEDAAVGDAGHSGRGESLGNSNVRVDDLTDMGFSYKKAMAAIRLFPQGSQEQVSR